MSLDTSKTYCTRDGRATGLRIKPWERKAQFLDRRFDGYEFEVVGDTTIHPGNVWVVACDGRYIKGLSAEHPWDLVVEGRASIHLDSSKSYRTRDGLNSGIRIALRKGRSVKDGGYVLEATAIDHANSLRDDKVLITDIFTADGRFLGDGRDHPLDLIEELPPAAPGGVSAPLRLEEGKLYSTRDGEHHNIAVVKSGVGNYPFKCREGYFKDCCFTADGHFNLQKIEDPWDLVAESLPAAPSASGKPAKLNAETAYRTRDGRYGGVFVAERGIPRYPWRVVAAQDDFMLARNYAKRGYFVSKNNTSVLDLVPDDGYRAPKPVAAPELPKPSSIEVCGPIGSPEWMGALRQAAAADIPVNLEFGGVRYSGCRASVSADGIELVTKVQAVAYETMVEMDARMRTALSRHAAKTVSVGTWVKLCDHIGTEGFLVAKDESTGRGFVRHSGDTHSIRLDRLETAPWRPRVGEPATWGGGAMAWPVLAIHGDKVDIGPMQGREALSQSNLRAPDKGSQIQWA